MSEQTFGVLWDVGTIDRGAVGEASIVGTEDYGAVDLVER